MPPENKNQESKARKATVSKEEERISDHEDPVTNTYT